MMVRGSYLLLLALWACYQSNIAQARVSERPIASLGEAILQFSPAGVLANLPAAGSQDDSKPAHAGNRSTIRQLKTAGSDDLSSRDGQSTAPPELPKDKQPPRAAAPDSSWESLALVDPPFGPTAPVVHTDYRKAMSEAVESRKMMLIYFYDPQMTAARRAFETLTLSQLEIQEKLKRYVVVKLPRDAQLTIDDKQVKLLEHGAFAEMLGRPGVAIIDLVHERADYYGHVVSTFSFTPGKYYRKEALSIILDLPPGTLTQRTMIYAVRIHPEAPKSTQGVFNRTLAEEANSHAHYQASIQLQGHHAWEARFHRINAKLPNDVLAQEVVAESWPNENLVEACVDCVHSWRQSPGHWGAVRSGHPLFGYDIKRGRNGIWYATGIFGLRRR